VASPVPTEGVDPAPSRVVLLHSALGDSRLWRPQVEALEGRFDVVAPDLPGWGDEPLPGEPFSFVERVAELLPAALVGNSFGGMVALRTALAHGDRVPRLVLVAPGMPGWEFGDEIRSYWAEEEAAIEAGDLDRATEVNLEFWLPERHRDLVRPQQRRALELQAAHPEPEVRRPPDAPAAGLRMPVLVVVGERDNEDFRAIAHHLAAEIPGARLVLAPDAGHLVGVEQPQRLNELLLDFLSAR
jgi:3-oxoadipate enol-lactonase